MSNLDVNGDSISDITWSKYLFETMSEQQEKQEEILRNWLRMIGYTQTICYDFDFLNRKVIIYANLSRLASKMNSSNINSLQDAVQNEYCGAWKIEFKEIRGGFVKA